MKFDPKFKGCRKVGHDFVIRNYYQSGTIKGEPTWGVSEFCTRCDTFRSREATDEESKVIEKMEGIAKK